MAFDLRFSGNAIVGGGEDRDGAFTIRGEVDADRIYLLKAYPWLLVRYDGVWNGSFVAGRSTIGPLARADFGRFEMWPEDEETTVREATRELELAV